MIENDQLNYQCPKDVFNNILFESDQIKWNNMRVFRGDNKL